MKTLFLFCLIFFTQTVLAMPAQILLIRHGEKPESGSELSPEGWQRAADLPSMFENRPEFLTFGLPVALYGMSPEKKNGSVRAIQTLKYLSAKLKLPIQTKFLKDDIKKLIVEIRKTKAYDGKTILICWEHTVLVDMAVQLGAPVSLHWPAENFDRVWTLTYSANGSFVKFQDLPEKLLPTDSQN
jgi:hypothetical protein